MKMNCKIWKIEQDRGCLSKKVSCVLGSLINYNAGKRGLEEIVCAEKTEAAAINILNASKKIFILLQTTVLSIITLYSILLK